MLAVFIVEVLGWLCQDGKKGEAENGSRQKKLDFCMPSNDEDSFWLFCSVMHSNLTDLTV